ncbi:hypothetical protein D3C76_1586550 [compost metagenome]
MAVVQTEIGQQYLEQRDAAAIGGVAVADAHAIGGAKPLAATRAALGRTAAGARGVVFGSVGEDAEFGDELHGVYSKY